MNMKSVIPALALMSILIAGAQAKDTDVSNLPGYVDLGSIKVPNDATEVRLVDLGPDMLSDVVKNDVEHDALARLISRIHAIHVKSFGFAAGQRDDLRSSFEQLDKKLAKGGWKRLIYVQSKDELVSVSTLHDNGGIAGWMVMVLDDQDATFANLVGNIDLGAIAGLAKGGGEGSLDSVLTKLQAATAAADTTK